MSDERAFLNGHAQAESLPPDLAAVEQRLVRDGAAWQQEMPATTRLAAYVNTRAPRDAAARSMLPHKGQHLMETNTNPDTNLRTTSVTAAHGWPRRMVALAMAALVVIFAFAVIATHAHGTVTTGPGSSGAHPTPTMAAATSIPFVGGAVIVSSVPGVTTPIAWIATTPSAFDVTGDVTIPDTGVAYKFTPAENVVTIVKLDSTAKRGDVVSAQWLLNGKDVSGNGPASTKLTDPIPAAVYFSLHDLVEGQGQVKIAYNGVVAYIATFFVITLTTPTPVTLPPTMTATPKPGTIGTPVMTPAFTPTIFPTPSQLYTPTSTPHP